MTGLQARAAPAVGYVRDLLEQGYVGEVLSTTLIGSGMGWGPSVEAYNAYLNDAQNGATLLSIALGHAADALCHCLGEIRELSATMTVRRTTITIAETGERKPMTAADQVCVSGLLEGGAALDPLPRRAFARHEPALGDQRRRGRSAALRRRRAGPDLRDGGARRPGRAVLTRDPAGASAVSVGATAKPGPVHQRRPGVRAVRPRLPRGNHLCPTFGDAVTRHRMLHAIETAAATGQRQSLS